MKNLAITDRLVIPAAELKLGFARSSGPGGQNVNKVESKVEVRWSPAESAALAGLREEDRAWLLDRLGSRLTVSGELVVTSSKTRDQGKNREDAMAKLAAMVRTAMARPKARRPTRPTRSSVARRVDAKKRRGTVKRDRSWSPEG